MTDQQAPGFPPPEDGWTFAVPPPAKCDLGRLPYPLVVKGPITADQPAPDKKRWQCTISRYAVYSDDREIMQWVETKGADGLGPFENGMLIFDNLSTTKVGTYHYQVVLSLLDKESDIIERHVVVKSDNVTVELEFKNSGIRLSKEFLYPLPPVCANAFTTGHDAKEAARKTIVESPLPDRPKLLKQFRAYLP